MLKTLYKCSVAYLFLVKVLSTWSILTNIEPDNKTQLSVAAIKSDKQRFNPLHWVQLQEMKCVNPIWLLIVKQRTDTARAIPTTMPIVDGSDEKTKKLPFKTRFRGWARSESLSLCLRYWYEHCAIDFFGARHCTVAVSDSHAPSPKNAVVSD